MCVILPDHSLVWHVYSDASAVQELGVYTYSVFVTNGRKQFHNKKQLPILDSVQKAEILGYIKGLRFTPKGSKVVLNYDIDELPALLTNLHRIGVMRRAYTELRTLAQEIDDRIVCLNRVDRLDPFYRDRHKLAGKLAKKISLKTNLHNFPRCPNELAEQLKLFQKS